jgi:hypothetical protein
VAESDSILQTMEAALLVELETADCRLDDVFDASPRPLVTMAMVNNRAILPVDHDTYASGMAPCGSLVFIKSVILNEVVSHCYHHPELVG